ncbi:hypothetical protein TNCV_3412491 [Trichonephila clavipes]|uniref:Uncharacterized protein n=1 Tax=Trichonephila clavipes TaxID=2585209 RepID=A0A8X6UV41_TRICX|nr:hypothetical protein TNCV_3412491 [Trichonephila clavipes]
MLVRVYEDQAQSMKCVYECFARFRKAGKVFLTTTVAEDSSPPSVTKALRKAPHLRHWVDSNTLKKLEAARTLEKFALPFATGTMEQIPPMAD